MAPLLGAAGKGLGPETYRNLPGGCGRRGGHSTQVTPAGIPGWRQGSKLTGPFSSSTAVEGGGGARGWVLAWLGVSLGFGGSSTRRHLRDLQKSLPSRVLSFLIHQMSGQLIFKTLSSGNITS